MKDPNVDIDRRSFLRGSSLFAGAVGLGLLSPLSALAQQGQDASKSKEKEKEKAKTDEERPARDRYAEEEQDGESEVLRDADGREYRVCPQCGYNMYRSGRLWTCDNCGYSYVE